MVTRLKTETLTESLIATAHYGHRGSTAAVGTLLACCLSVSRLQSPTTTAATTGKTPAHANFENDPPAGLYWPPAISMEPHNILPVPTPSRVGGPCETTNASIQQTIHRPETVTRRYYESYCLFENTTRASDSCDETTSTKRGEVGTSCAFCLNGLSNAIPSQGPHFLINDLLARKGTNRQPSFHNRHDLDLAVVCSFFFFRSLCPLDPRRPTPLPVCFLLTRASSTDQIRPSDGLLALLSKQGLQLQHS